MTLFTIGEKEHELKITYKSVKHLEGLFEGGSLGFIEAAMSGSLTTFSHVIHAALFHTGENYSLAQVDAAIETAFDSGLVDLTYIYNTINEVVLDSFFFAKVVRNLKAKNPEAFKQMNEILTTNESSKTDGGSSD